MLLPIALAPPLALLIAIGLFFLLRWWTGRTGAAFLFTLSLILNFTLLAPLVLATLLAQEVVDFQQKLPTAPKLLLVERGPEVMLAVSFTEVKDLEKGFASFTSLSKEQTARLTQLGDAKYLSLAKDYYKVFIIKRDLLEKLAIAIKPPPLAPVGTPVPYGQSSPQDPAAVQRLLSSAYDAFMSGDLDRVARTAADLQKAFRDRGINDGAELARQIEQAARAKDAKTLESLGPRLIQYASTGGGLGAPGLGGPPGGGLPTLPISGEVILKVIDADDPAKVLGQYLPARTIQDLIGGNTTNLKLMLIAYLFQVRFQNGLDPMFLISEYKKGTIQVYPDSTLSTIVKLIPTEPLGLPTAPKTKP